MTTPFFHRNWIAIAGKRNSGKDLVAKYLANYLRKTDPIYGQHIFILGLADSLKEEYCQLTGLTLEKLEETKEIHRTSLQDLGENKRKERPDYWIGKLFAKISSLPQVDSYVIVKDIRYRNEADVMVALGQNIWRVIRPSIKRDKPEDKHASEIDLDYWNGVYTGIIRNDCCLETLQARVERLADVYFEQNYGNRK